MKINVNGVELYYEVTGRGEPLIMLHGNGESHEIFAEAAEVLKDYFTVYLIDSRGHGKSTKLSGYHYQDMADDVRAFVSELKIDNATLYGFSDGGITGLLLASQTKLFKRYIISGANIDPDGVSKLTKAAVKMLYFFKRDPLLKLMLEEPHISPEELGRITDEVVILAGSRDVIREDHTRAIHAAVPGSRLEILEGCTHGSYVVHSTEIAGLILKYCGKS